MNLVHVVYIGCVEGMSGGIRWGKCSHCQQFCWDSIGCRRYTSKPKLPLYIKSPFEWATFLLQSESVNYHLRAPVLFHESFKPAYSCITAIRSYFASLPSPIRDRELIIVGDRIFTDVVLANRMHLQNCPQKGLLGSKLSRDSEKDDPFTARDGTGDLHPFGPLSVWTTGVWERESMIMRWLEHGLVKLVQRCSTPPPGEAVDTSRFLKVLSKPEPRGKLAELEDLFARLRRR